MIKAYEHSQIAQEPASRLPTNTLGRRLGMEDDAMPSREEAVAFVNRLEELTVSQVGGMMGIPMDALQALVRENPELTVLVTRTYLQLGTSKRSYFQIAGALAGIYEAEFGDDSLSRLVARTLKDAGATDAVPELRAVGPGPDAPQKPHGLQINIERETLEARDVYGLVRNFSIDRAEPAELPILASLRARCFLTFSVDDSREVWQIPAVREFMARLSEVLPYFPYYLTPIPEVGAFFVYFASLADPDAVWDGPQIDLSHPSVHRELSRALAAIKGLCLRLGEDPRRACGELLAPIPPDVRDELMAGVGLGGGDGH